MIENKAPINGLSGSIKLGVEACRACDADAVLIALADMPRVTATHIYRLLDYADGADTILASNDGVRRHEERRVGKECVSQCRSQRAPYHKKKTERRPM